MSYLPRSVPTWPEVALRALTAALALALAWAAAAVPPAAPPDPEAAFRAPLDAEEDAVVALARHVTSLPAGSGTVTVAFLGASETYGYSVAETASTFPESFESAARADQRRLSAYNLATRGQQAGDLYVLGQALAGRADVLLVQLTYLNLGGEPRAPRFPRMASALGVPLSGRLAASIGMQATPPFDLGAALRRRLDAARLPEAARAVSRRLFGGPPKERLPAALAPLLPPSLADAAEPMEEAPPSDPFDLQDPALQTIAVSRYAEAASFTVSPEDPRLGALARMAEDARRRGTEVVFFLPPLNAEALEMYGALDRERYLADAAAAARALEPAPLVDLGLSAGLPASSFTDITHTTAEGGTAVGRALYADRRVRAALERAVKGR